MSSYHDPVLLRESVDALITSPEGTYIDLTFGGGGHSREILNNLTSKGRLIAFDQDEDAERNLLHDERLIFLKSNFRHLYRYWKWLGIEKVDGVLGDLGVSSFQFDEAQRGFSFRFDAELDMRMNKSYKNTAADILMRYERNELQDMFSRYGEIRNAKTLASEIMRLRESGEEIVSSFRFNQILDRLRVGDRNKYFAQVYQALRIELNEEMLSLEEVLEACVKIVKPGGRIVMISYHSLEDRLVKKFFRSGNAEGRIEKDMYGQSLSSLKQLGKIVIPDNEEQKRNPRSRSAKMRVAELKILDDK
ncbi:MAG: 16S rRNA (cytosine(1402)-N(4))-methyltransferase RsmH [Chitinophagia bacterium]|nr:16S rRNA (cytosine(1402)-N(4))-methyltransferase RsmH [Chitinophagia bacterium]